MPIPRGCGPARHGPRRHHLPTAPAHQCEPGVTLPRPRLPRPASVWPCATTNHRENIGLIVDWLPTAVIRIVTTYTQPRDHLLFLIPPGHLDAVAERPPPGSNGWRGSGAFAGLAEADWAVTQLGRVLHTQAPARTDSRTPDHYPLIITAVDPRATQPIPTREWADLLHPRGILAVITHSDSSASRLIDPTGTVVHTVRHAGLTYLDHIALLHLPLPHGALDAPGATPLRPGRHRRPGCAAVRVHSDLLIFSRIPGADAPADREETSDA